MAPIKVNDRIFELAGEIVEQQGFDEWLLKDGKALLEKTTAEKGFSLLGKEYAAKKDLLAELRQTDLSKTLRASLQNEVRDYSNLPGRIAASTPGLPLSGNTGHPVVAVPRFRVNKLALDSLHAHFDQSDEFAHLRDESMRGYYLYQLVAHLDAALGKIKASPASPFPSHEKWLIVGFDPDYRWDQNLETGHYLVYESFDGKVPREDRKVVEEKVNILEALLGRISAEEKRSFLQGLA
jgi:hypothetical protein